MFIYYSPVSLKFKVTAGSVVSFGTCTEYLLSIFQISILEGEFCFLPLTPSRLVIEVYVRALLVIICDLFRFLVPLEPSKVLLVEAPRLVLQLLGSQVSTHRLKGWDGVFSKLTVGMFLVDSKI